MDNLPDSNVTELIKHVNENLKVLEAANEMTHDLPINLFKDSRRCKDKAFKSWLGRRYDDYTQKKDPIPPDAKKFMKEVETCCKDRVKPGEWGKQEEEEEERIIALRAELAAKMSAKPDTRCRGDRATRKNEKKERW